ncbi:MAG: lysylphosphatidylglycerol synthase domain-containing protein, partial [archaeon]
AWFLKKHVRMGEGVGNIALYRVSLGIVTLLVGVVGTLLYFPFVQARVELLGAGLIVLGIAFIVLSRGGFRFLVSLVPATLATSMKGFLTTIREKVRDPLSLLVLGLTGFIQLALVSGVYTLMFAVTGHPIDFPILFTVISLIQLAVLIPISINGLGIREGLMGVLLQPFGIPPEVSVGIAIVNTATGYALAFILSLFVLKKIA